MKKADWNIGRRGRIWSDDECMPRYSMAPEKIELINGQLFWSEEERLTMLALLLENVGIDNAISLGDSNIWREAIEVYKDNNNG